MAVSIPKDVLLEILFRVKDVPAALFRCATICNLWHQLVVEPSFLRRCWPDQDVSSSLVGFFTEQIRWPCTPMPCFTPTPRSALVPRLRSMKTLMPAAPAGVFDDAVALVARHGLLLVRLDTNATRGYLNTIILELAVCNLLTGTCHMLPSLKLDSAFDLCDWNGYAILTAADCRSNEEPELPSNSSFFKVVIVSSYNNKSSLHTFSSVEATWSVRPNCLDYTVKGRKYGPSSRAVVRRSTAHWLLFHTGELCFCVLNLNMRTGHISLTKVSFRMNSHLNSVPLLTLAVNGALSLLWMQEEGTQIEIWEQHKEQPNKDGGPEWVCTGTIKLEQLGDERRNMGGERSFLGENCGTLLIHDTLHGVYTVDLQTGMMEEVVDWPCGAKIIPMETVPLSVNWPAIFATRLDTRKQKMQNQVTYPPGWEVMYLRGNKIREPSDNLLGGN